MIHQIIQLSIILSFSVYGTNTFMRPQLAISSQKFHREDVPLSYKFEAVHDYVRPQKLEPFENNRPHKIEYQPIQFAPLGGTHKVYESNRLHKEESKTKRPASQLQPLLEQIRADQTKTELAKPEQTKPNLTKDLTNPHKNRQDLTREDPIINQLYNEYESKNVRLEPRYVAQPNNQNLYANIGGYNNALVKEEKHVKPNPLQYRQAQIPLFVYSPKPNHSTVKNILPAIVSKKQYAFEYVPVEPRQKSLHETLEFEKISALYQHAPKLHINIARGFNAPKAVKALQTAEILRPPKIASIPVEDIM